MEAEHKYNKRAVIRFAGAFIAWVIGSGFATGQEVLQFFTSYGYLSYGVIIINLIGFLFLGRIIFINGFKHKKTASFNHFKYYCGKRVGQIYSLLIPVILALIMPIFISGAGATFFECFGIKHYIGSAIMAIAVLYAYLIGFERLLKIVSSIGPFIIIFLILVGLISIFKNYPNFSGVKEYTISLNEFKPVSNWFLSGILYLSLVFLGGSTYFTKIGMTAENKKDAKYGALWGALALVLAIAIINTAILLNAGDVLKLAVPVLFLAKKISILFGGFFSIVVLLGMFSACSTMMWSVCSRFIWGGKRGNKVFAVFITICIYILGLLPFGRLIAIFYPFIGYAGLIYMFCVAYRGLKVYFTKEAKGSHI